MFSENGKVMRFGMIIVLLMGMLGITPVIPALAATLMVTTTNNSGTGSLAQAIASAASGDTIQFDPSLSGQTIMLESPIVINNKKLILDGSGLSPQVTIDGGGRDGIFFNGSAVLDIYDLTIVNFSSGLIFRRDATIRNSTLKGFFHGIVQTYAPAVLTIDHSTLADSQGVAVSSSGPALTITNSVLINNTHGAIQTSGPTELTIANSTISNNGGRAITFSAPSTISNSTISHNQGDAVTAGGALTIIDSNIIGNYGIGILVNRSLSMTNTTIYQNKQEAIELNGNVQATIVNSTISQNHGYPADIRINGGSEVDIYNSTIVSNAGDAIFFYSPLLNIYNSMLVCKQDEECVHSANGIPFNNVNSVILFINGEGFGQLADYGGPTLTLALHPEYDGFLIDQGDDTICANPPVSNRDQRGVTRPYGEHCDIGAFEYNGDFAPTTTTLTTFPNPSEPGQSVTVTATVDPAGNDGPTGTVDVLLADTVLCTITLDNSTGTCDITLDTAGTVLLTANYHPDTHRYMPSSDSVTHVVGPVDTITTITDTPDPSMPSNPVNISVRVRNTNANSGGSTPTGMVTVLTDAGTCTITLNNGQGSCPITFSKPGSFLITADYAGDDRHLASSDVAAHEVLADVSIPVHYVKWDANGSNDGTSWENAHVNLQSALAAASSGDEIWVAAGIYKPTIDPTDRMATFKLKSGVAVYGGFEGTETSRQERNPSINLTVLSGDIDNNDSQTPIVTDLTSETGNAANSFRVVTGATNATLDGFTITAGNADFEIIDGAGLYNSSGSLTLANIILTGNSAARNGGGMFHYASNATLVNITFSNNRAGNGGGFYNQYSNGLVMDNVTFSNNKAIMDGGGMYNYGSSSQTLTKTAFNNNLADRGGGLSNYGSSPTLTDVSFNSNSANLGGGLSNMSNSKPRLTNVSFNDNQAAYDGGGMYSHASPSTLLHVIFKGNSAKSNGGGLWNAASSPILTDVIFENNKASRSGGGMENYNSSNASLANVTFAGNSAVSGGGLYNSTSSNAILTNVTFSGNLSSVNGGAMFNDHSNPALTNVTFSGNSATPSSSTNRGGGMYNLVSNPTIRNTIFWGNTSPSAGAQIYNHGTSAAVISNSIVQDGCPTGSICTSLITEDPLLGPLMNNGGFTQTMMLGIGSPAIDAGESVGCPTTDQRDRMRPQDGNSDGNAICDIGAYEADPDLTPPTVSSVVRVGAETTNAASVDFVVVFSKSVTGVDTTVPLSDFALTTTGVTGAFISGVSGSGTTYTVTVNTGSGNGTIRLDVIDDDSIVDLFDSSLGGDGVGNGDFTAGEEYSIVKSAPVPGTPSLLSPANGTLVTSVKPLLDWSDVSPSAYHYQIQIATDKAFNAPVDDNVSFLDSQYIPTSDLEAGKLYYWRVRALNVIAGASGWSAIRSFKTPLAQPLLTSPTQGETLPTDRPIFDWEEVSGATQYILQASGASSFNTLLVNITLDTTEYSMTQDLPQNRNIYWRVRAKSSVVTSRWSAGAFKTGNPPSVPVLVAPAHGTLVKSYTPLLDWQNSSIPTGTTFKHYELQVDDQKDFSSPEITALQAVSKFTPGSDLVSNTKYYWRVRAVITVGGQDHSSGWSVIWSFRTVIAAPQSLTINPTTNPLRPSFDWDDATRPISGYTIQISTSANFSTLLVNSTTLESTYTILKDLPSGKTIYCRVRVNGVNGPSAWSKTQFLVP